MRDEGNGQPHPALVQRPDPTAYLPPSRQLVAIFNSPKFSISAFEAELWDCRNQPIEVNVTNDDRWPDNSPRIEKAKIFKILQILGRHLHRLQTLKIFTAFSTSLPLFPIDFNGASTSLKELELVAVDHDEGVNMVFANLAAHLAFPFTYLTSLIITGRNCYMLSRDPTWTDKIPHVTNLTISQFTPQPGEVFTLPDLMMPIATMPALQHLSIYNLNVDISGEPLAPVGPTHLCLNLEEMSDFSISAAIVNFLEPCSLNLVDSSVGADLGGFGDSAYEGVLNLHLIRQGQNLAPLLTSWAGHFLEVTSCPTFTDAILDLMCTRDHLGNFLCARQMKTLVIISDYRYLDVSIGALKRLVNARSRSKNTRLKTIGIRVNANAPDLSEADSAWFDRRLDHFVYRRKGDD